MKEIRPLLWMILVFSLASSLSAQGIVVETVAVGSAPEKAGAREGDVFHSWTRLANLPIHPEPASGTLESPFDWQWMEIEQAPRGTVELRGERRGEPLVLQVPIGLWEAQVRPVLPADLESLYQRGKELVDKEQVEEGMTWWQQVAERAGADWRLRCWIWLRIGAAWDGTEGGGRQAAEAYATALRESRDPLSRIAALDALGENAENQERLDEAEVSHRSALELTAATWGESLQMARSRFDLGWTAYLRSQRAAAQEQPGQLAVAREQIEGALAVQERWAPGGVAVARSLNGLGVVALQRGDLNTAAIHFNQSLSISTRLQPASPAMAATLFNLGKLTTSKGELDQGQHLHQQALLLMREVAQPSPLTANILSGLGRVALLRGDLALAEDYFRRTLSLQSKRAPESLSVTSTLDNLGGVAKLRGDLDSAEEYFKSSLRLRLRLAPGSRYVARSLGLLSDLAEERGDLETAERYLRELLSLYGQSTLENQAIGLGLANLGDIALERGDLAAAENHYQRSLEIRKKLVANKVGESLYNLGTVAVRRGDLKAAESYFREALASDARSPLRNWPRASLLQTLANVLRQTGRLQQAVRYADLSIEALETQIGQLGGSLETQGRFRGQRGDVYRDALRLQVELGHPREAFHLLERFRAQAFLALLAERDLTFAVDLSPELDQERRRLAVSYDRNQLRLASLDPEKDREAVEALQRMQAQLRRRREEISTEMRRTAPRLAALQEPQALTFEQVRAALDPGTVMLSYSVGKEQTHLFIVTPERELQVETLKVGRQVLEQDVDRFRQLIEQTQSGPGLGAEGLGWFSRRLYNLLVEPAEKWIAAGERILLVPDGPLHLLPFAALTRKDGRHLVEWKPLSTVLSGTVFAELKKQRRDTDAVAEPSARQWVAFGDPWFPPRLVESRPEDIGEARLRSFSTRAQLRWKRLPQSRREVEEIAALFPADRRRTYVDRDASEERAKAVGKSARIVHFATHGFVDDRSPFDSGLVLSIPEDLAEGRDNGLLQVWEIFESVRLDADLVVLSACETGIGEIRGGEGIIGLTRAFQYAGARSVLASLWRVEDEATAELMQRFYRHLRAGKAKDEALRAAQLELIRRPLRVPDGRGGWIERNAAAPYFWAALQLVGDGL